MGIGKEIAREEGYNEGLREGYMMAKTGEIPNRFISSEVSE